MYIIISGMNNITINLAKKFISDGNEITFIGLDKNKAEEIEKQIRLVTDIGSILAHGSIVAREFGIPAVLGLGNVTQRLKSGQRIMVDGDTGTIEILD